MVNTDTRWTDTGISKVATRSSPPQRESTRASRSLTHQFESEPRAAGWTNSSSSRNTGARALVAFLQKQCLDLPGSWEVGQMPENHAAQTFSREVIDQYTGSQFKEHELRTGWWQGIVQVFESCATR